MILYSVTINVDDTIHDDWLDWMEKEHIPEVMDTECFVSAEMFRVVSPEPEEGTTYCVQYVAGDISDYERYQIEHAAILQTKHKDKFGKKFTAVRTVMESMDDDIS
jgi:hypothetical protein